jgi:HAD superfamily hydrolase (TIGR01549 family)
MSAPSYDAWLLDFDGTLYDARFVRLAMAAELALTGWNAISVLRAFRKQHELIRSELHGEAPVISPYALQIERTATALAIQREIVERLVGEWMIRRPGRWLKLFRRRSLQKEIVTFRASGGKTALVSDYPVSDKLKAIGCGTLFDVIVASGETGGPRRLKPAPDGYLAAAQRLGIAPERCLVIGDRADADGKAAEAAGMAFRLVK